MRVLAVVLALAVSAPAAMTFAQTPAPAPSTQKPAQPAQPAPAAPRPQGQTPAAPAQPAELPKFQPGFKYAFIRFPVVVQASAEGKRAQQEIQALQDQRQKEITEKDKQLQSLQDQLQTQGGVWNEAKKIQAQNDIERGTRDIQRMVEDAKADVQKLTEQLQQSFMFKLNPIIERLAKEKQLDMIFNANESGLVWANPGMDLTGDVIAALDGGAGAAKPAAATPPAAPPAAPPVAPAPVVK